jgi:hypothetical protein
MAAAERGQGTQPATAESTEELVGRRGSPVISSDGERVGVIEEIFEDVDGGMPEWIGLGSGVFYARRHLVPLQDVAVNDDGVHVVRYTKDTIKDAPEAEIVEDEFLAPASERDLAVFYGLPSPPAGETPRLRIRRYVQDEPVDPPGEPAESDAD